MASKRRVMVEVGIGWTSHGKMEVEADSIHGVWAVTPAIVYGQPSRHEWTVTHVPTGLAGIFRATTTLAKARKIARRYHEEVAPEMMEAVLAARQIVGEITGRSPRAAPSPTKARRTRPTRKPQRNPR